MEINVEHLKAVVRNVVRENLKTSTKNAFEWAKDMPKPSKKVKETAFGSWAEFEKKTGMTKEQYLAREKNIGDELAEIEVNGSIYKGR